MNWLKKAAVLIALTPALAFAQVHIEVSAPSFRWAEPPHLVVVTPGVQVVEDYDQEVFYIDGWYWSRSGDNWFRSQDHAGHWAVVETRAVPSRLVSYEPGRFRHYRGQRVAPPAARAPAPRVIVVTPKKARPGRGAAVAPGHGGGNFKSQGHGHGHGKN